MILRFRDDISLHLTGKEEDILLALEIIVTNYPKHVETEFLNMKLFNLPKMQEPFTTVQIGKNMQILCYTTF